MEREVQRVTIEIEPAEPIQGRIVDGSGSPQAFHGWLELSAALERARGDAGAAAADAQEPELGASH